MGGKDLAMVMPDTTAPNMVDEISTAPCGEKPRRDAPDSSRRNLRHGLYSARAHRWLSEYGNKQAAQFRQHLENLLAEAYSGEIPLYVAALIQSAVECTKCAAANREILASAGEVKIEVRAMLDKAYVELLHKRDLKLQALGLDPRAIDAEASRREPADWSFLPADPPTPPPPATPPAQ